MGCAASSTVNTADDAKSPVNTGSSENVQLPKPITDSGDLKIVGTLNYGDQIENEKDIIQETTNFHNSPVMISPDRRSENLSSQSISYSNKHSKSLHTEVEVSKSNPIKVSSPVMNKSNSRNDEELSTCHSSISAKDKKDNNSRVSSADQVGDTIDQIPVNAEEINDSHETSEKIYHLTSPQDSLKSNVYSHNSNIVYRPTASSEEERKESRINRSPEFNHINNSRSETKSLDNPLEEYWNQDPKGVSNGNSVNNNDYDQSSRNSRFSHTYTGSIHSPFFDSLNHGYSNCDNDENQNHDEVTETINGRLILGTGDSENFVNGNDNFQLIIQSILPIKNCSKSIDEAESNKELQTNLLATGDKCFCTLEQSNEDNTLDLDNNPLNNDLSDDQIPSSQQHLSTTLSPGDKVSDNMLSLKSEYMKTAEINDEKCEGLLIGINSSPVNSNSRQTSDQLALTEELTRRPESNVEDS